MDIALKERNQRRRPAILNLGYFTIIVFLNSQAAIRRIKNDYIRAGQSITKAIIAKTAILTAIKVFTTIKWVLS
jgi:predicted nucleic acid-binding protein